jgi:hypothetical protein
MNTIAKVVTNTVRVVVLLITLIAQNAGKTANGILNFA